MKFLRRAFLTGLLVLTPTVITGYIVWKIFISIDSRIEPLQRRFPLIDLPGIGFIVILLFIVITGMIASNLIGRRFFGAGERILNSLPIVRRIYFAIKEISEVFLTDKKTAFQRVVLIHYPHERSYALAFVTKDSAGFFNELAGEALISVFIPTTPNPTSGFMLMIPARDVTPVDISVEEAMKMVISGGAFSPATLDRISAERTS